jgi:hypothetical protein
VVRDTIIWTICLILVSIVLVFVSPVTSVAPAALRTSPAATAFLLLLVMAAAVMAPLFSGTDRISDFCLPANHSQQSHADDLLVLNCSRLC